MPELLRASCLFRNRCLPPRLHLHLEWHDLLGGAGAVAGGGILFPMLLFACGLGRSSGLPMRAILRDRCTDHFLHWPKASDLRKLDSAKVGIL